jgi:hypothetical protein
MVVRMLPFWLSIGLLSVLQGSLVALPRPPRAPALERLRAGGWAAVMPISVIAFVLIARAAESASAQGLTYLALIAVPPLAALALGVVSRGARPVAVALVPLLFALAWADSGGFAGNLAATVLSALSCVALGALLGAVTPSRWLAAGILAMAIADSALVISDLLQRPNSALNAAHPAAGLPRLQSAVIGSAVMGYGDLFIAGVLGGLLAASSRPQSGAAALAAALAVGFDLLFFFVEELPATVPVALTLIVLELRRRRRSARRPSGAGPGGSRTPVLRARGRAPAEPRSHAP